MKYINNIFNCLKRLTILTIMLAPLSHVSELFAAPMDFNGDGASDATVVVVRNEKLDWVARVLGQKVRVGRQFGQIGVHLMPADYAIDGMTDLAYVNSDGTWKIKVNDTNHSVEFGSERATYLGGMDIDGDGRADLAYRTQACSSKIGQLNLLTNPLENNARIQFKAGAGWFPIFYMDSNADGIDEICLTKPNRNAARKLTGTFRAICKNPINQQIISNFKLARMYGIPQRLKTGANSADYLVVSRSKGGRTLVVVRNTAGKVVHNFTFPVLGTLVFGNFTNTVGELEQIGLHLSNGKLQVFDLQTKQLQTVNSNEGIPVDQINISTFVNGQCYCDTSVIAKNSGRCILSDNDDDSDNKGVISGACQVNRSINDGANVGFLHKPVAEGRSEPVNLFARSDDPSACWYEYSNNELFKNMYFSSYSNPDRPTFRPSSGGSCSTYPNDLIVACNVRGVKNCWNIPDPCTRYD